MPECNPTEIWKPIKGHEGRYSVSSMGRIRRDARGIHTRPGKILKGLNGQWQYDRVWLSGGSAKIRTRVSVHLVVIETFIGPRPIGMQCNHKNGIKTDNRAVNLEWVTVSQNIKHGFDVLGRISARGEKIGSSKLTPEKVLEIRRRLSSGEKQRTIATDMKVCQATINHIRIRKTWAWM